MNSIVKTGQNAAVNFLTPNNLQEAMQIAGILAESDIVPKDYQRKPGNILVAMQWGAEIGLQPLQAMQNIAVINGRPSIWGDAMLALVRGSGLLDFIREEISEDGQKATVTVKRKNEEPVASVFTMEDAKKAGLSGKQGPWTQYPKRMLKLRARSYALRDVFPDVLKGMAIAEAEIDLTPYYQRIDNATSLEELDQIGADIAELNLGEPAKSEIGEVFKAKRKELKAAQAFPAESVQAVIEEIGNTADLEALNAIMESRFEPFTAQMTEEHISQINSAYEAQEAALTP